MSKELPLHDWEKLTDDEPYVGRSWTVRSEHHGHTMTVLGRIEREGRLTSMLIVKCECGEMYRMAIPTVEKGLRKEAQHGNRDA